MINDLKFSNIDTYYILTRKINIVDYSVYGDISGPFTTQDISNNHRSDFNNVKTNMYDSIIYNLYPDKLVNSSFIVGIPERNNNNISKKQIYNYMYTFDIAALQNIKPYKKLAGNDISIIDNCNNNNNKKVIYNSQVIPLSLHQKNNIYFNNNFKNKICYFKL